MTEDQAIDLLRFHAQNSDRSKNVDGYGTASPSEHPDANFLCEKFFVEVMKSLRVLSKRFSDQTIEKEIVANLMKICHKTNEWQNSRADQHDNPHVMLWCDVICKAVVNLLRGHHAEDEFEEFEKYQNSSSETNSAMSYD